jgi:hypothetical protein
MVYIKVPYVLSLSSQQDRIISIFSLKRHFFQGAEQLPMTESKPLKVPLK